MIVPQPLLAVSDVVKSSRWYGRLLGAEPLGKTKQDIHGNVYNRLIADGEVVLQLHSWDDEDHPNLTRPDAHPVGYGVLVWFVVEDFEQAFARARELKAEILVEPQVNPGPRNIEMWLRDPDGYVVVIASPDGAAV